MFRSKMLATVGALATAAACTVLASPVASAAPSQSPACGVCWSVPRAAAGHGVAWIAANVGSGIAHISL